MTATQPSRHRTRADAAQLGVARSTTCRSGGQRLPAVAAGAVLVALAAGCSEEAALSTIPSLPPTPAPPTAAPSRTDLTDASDPTTSNASPPQTGATTPPTESSTTTSTLPPNDDEATVRAEIERDFLANGEVLWDLASRPTRRNLDQRLSEVMVEGSRAYRQTRANILELVERDERITLSEPPVRETTVEHVELVGEMPYEEAKVTYCSVNNANRVADLPNGQVAVVGTPQDVHATRWQRSLRKAEQGWKEYALVEGYLGRWKGDQCRGN